MNKEAGEMEAGDQTTADNSKGSNIINPIISSDEGGFSMMKIGICILDFVLRVIAAIGTLASALTMGTTNETQPFVSLQFIQFVSADFSDIPTFTFFVIANSVVCAYLVLSLPLSIFHLMIRSPASMHTRIILAIFDTLSLALVTAGGSSAAAIVYLAHEGNGSADWSAICGQFNSFCERISGSLVGSFTSAVIFILLIVTSFLAISRRPS